MMEILMGHLRSAPYKIKSSILSYYSYQLIINLNSIIKPTPMAKGLLMLLINFPNKLNCFGFSIALDLFQNLKYLITFDYVFIEIGSYSSISLSIEKLFCVVSV